MKTTAISHRLIASIATILFCIFFTPQAHSQANGEPDLIQKIDAAVRARDAGIESYTVNEHYAVFRGKDEEHPAAEMRVKTTYQKKVGKTYTILEQSGSDLMRKEVLGTILDHEKEMSKPDTRMTAVITSANYDMQIKGAEARDGRNSIALSLKPKRISPFLFNGTIWADSQDGSIIALDGVAAKSASMITGPAQIARHYALIDGFPMAIHASAVSNSWLLGRTVIKIDYTGYEIHPVTAR